MKVRLTATNKETAADLEIFATKIRALFETERRMKDARTEEFIERRRYPQPDYSTADVRLRAFKLLGDL